MPPATAPTPAPTAAPTGPPTMAPVTAPVVAPAAAPFCACAASGSESAAATATPASSLVFMMVLQSSIYTGCGTENVRGGSPFPQQIEFLSGTIPVPTFPRLLNCLNGQSEAYSDHSTSFGRADRECRQPSVASSPLAGSRGIELSIGGTEQGWRDRRCRSTSLLTAATELPT